MTRFRTIFRHCQFRLLLLLLLGLFFVQSAHAQFYYNGRGPMNLKWEQIKSPYYKLVYPTSYAPMAMALAGFMDSIAPTITHGFTRQPQRLPIILQTENLHSNGEVVWAPKRMELATTAPAGDISADLWIKQLSVHESRHVVQLSALRGGLTKVASWILGEAGTSVGMLVVPKWFFEGDATLAETQYSEFGRGYQPSFTVGMRAIFAADSSNVNLRSDRWVAGSYRSHVPSYYEYGYQVVAAGERYHGTKMWGGSVEYAGKYPIFVYPMRIYLRRNYGVNLTSLRHQALKDLDHLWKPYSAVPNSYTTLTKPGRSYTTYSDPMAFDAGVIATKTDYDTPVRFVAIDTISHRERTVAWISPPSSRPVVDKGTLYWTEFKPHPVWEYKNYSVVRSLNLATGKRKVYGRWEANYFATPLRVSSDDEIGEGIGEGMGDEVGDEVLLLATVSPDSLGGSDLVLHEAESFREIDRLRFDMLTTLHGLAWDSTSRTLSFIALGEQGMQLCGVRVDGTCRFGEVYDITAPSMSTLSGLNADGRGNLYFSSIESGKDEIHTIDLTTDARTERRITTSRFGAYTPSASSASSSSSSSDSSSTTADSAVLFTTYTADGYMIARGSTADTKDTVRWSRLPKNLLNIPSPSWDVPVMAELPMKDTATTHKTKKYHKALRWFNVHSWAPIAADLDDIMAMDERSLNIGFGGSLFFQSAMGDSYGSAAYGRLRGDNWLQASWTYAGLPVLIGVDVEYGGGKQDAYISADDFDDGVRAPSELKNYLDVTASIAAPFNFSGGSNFRLFQPSFTVTHLNSLLYESDGERFTQGYHKYQASLWWSNNRRASKRSILPRLGYALRADLTGAFNDRFGMIYSLYARGYVPGMMQNHSITLRAAGMYQSGSELNFTQKPLFPRGANNSWAAKYYGAAAVDYTFPLCYPDGGINGIAYFKRIWLNLFGDYSRGAYFAAGGTTLNRDIWSYGGDIAFDVNFLGSTTPATLKFTFAQPSNDSFYIGFGFDINF